jgi:phosphonatase-like hydrolase
VYTAFVKYLRKLYVFEGVEEVAGAANVFHTLHEHAIHVALNTGFDREITGILLKALGWDSGIVDAVVCGNDVAEGRPAPDLIFRAMQLVGVSEADHVANVGDTALDLQAGSNAGVRWNIGVLSGAHSREILESEVHTHLLASVAEVPGLWGFD